MTTTELATLLAPARVLDIEGRALKLSADGREFGATLALPYPYKPQVGDKVLVISQGRGAWVIGVIEGAGLTVFSAPADLELRATRGRIVLNARDEVAIKADDVNVNALNVNTSAQNLSQQADTLETQVKGRCVLRASDAHTEVEQTFSLRAHNINEVARREVKINAELINLG